MDGFDPYQKRFGSTDGVGGYLWVGTDNAGTWDVTKVSSVFTVLCQCNLDSSGGCESPQNPVDSTSCPYIHPLIHRSNHYISLPSNLSSRLQVVLYTFLSLIIKSKRSALFYLEIITIQQLTADFCLE